MNDICERCHMETTHAWINLEVINVEIGHYRRHWHLCNKCAKKLRDILQGFILKDDKTDEEDLVKVVHKSYEDGSESWELHDARTNRPVPKLKVVTTETPMSSVAHPVSIESNASWEMTAFSDDGSTAPMYVDAKQEDSNACNP